MMNKRQAQRLLDVATALRDAAEWEELAQKFDMGEFGHDNTWLDDPYEGDEADDVDTFYIKKECGTPACALGHYAVRDDLQKTIELTRAGTLQEARTGKPISYDDDLSWDVGNYFSNPLQRMFGLDRHDLQELFGGDGCRGASTPLEAAQYIENFLAERGWEVAA